jgi:epoxyqueuosine reductase QueG
VSDADGTTYEDLQELALSMGASLFGVADRDRVRADTDLLDACYKRFTRGVSVGVRLDAVVLAGITDGPTPEYAREYQRVNTVLDSIAEALERRITAGGFNALQIPASKVTDWEKLRGHLSHKLIGRYAGLGWIGKNILLVNSEFGSRVRYVTVLTDAALEADGPTEAGCGTCSTCAEVCPAGAPAEDPSDFDLPACFVQVTEFNERLDRPHFICGICIKACRGKALTRQR